MVELSTKRSPRVDEIPGSREVYEWMNCQPSVVHEWMIYKCRSG